MKRYVLSPAVLDHLRTIGDPAVEGDGSGDVHQIPAQRYFQTVAASGLVVALDKQGDAGTTVRAKAIADGNACIAAWTAAGIDVEQCVKDARDLFARAGDEICAALLLAALPETYATAWGAPVLIENGGMVWALPRRIRQTALFLMTLLSANDAVVYEDPNAVEAKGRYKLVEESSADDDTAAFVDICAGLRLFHHVLRRYLRGYPKAGDKAINQEDLLGTLLTFTVTAFRVLDIFGVALSDGERDAYFVFWDIVGACLGIGTTSDPEGVRPEDVDVATKLLGQLHDRQWTPVQETIWHGRPFPWSGLVDGRTLNDALLGALADAMPPAQKLWPAIVMRELVAEPVRARLGLDRESASVFLGDRLARFAPGQRTRGASLRFMANDVTRHAMESFLKADGPPFEIPGLDLEELTLRPPSVPPDHLALLKGP